MKLVSTLAVLAALGTGSLQAAGLSFTFDTDLQGFGAAERGVPAWSAGSVQADGTGSGWAWTIKRAFDETERAAILAAAGQGGTLSFDLTVNHATSFGPNGGTTSDWFQINLVGNSSAGGWKQLGNIFTLGGWHDLNDTSVQTMTVEIPLSDLGLNVASTWSEIQFGQNSGALPVNFLVDNVEIAGVTPVPEPASAALIGLGALALWLRRRA